MKKSLYEYQSYKSYLRDYVEANRVRGLISILAKAAGCDRTYLSQALNSKVQLTPDHILGLSDYLRLETEEEDYLLHLLLKERAATPKIQNKINEKLKSMRLKAQTVSATVNKKSKSTLSLESKSIYYSSWLYSAVHLLTSDSNFQSTTKISSRLNISSQVTQKVLRDLTQIGLVKQKGNQFIYSGENIHVNEDDPLYLSNHSHWRSRAQIAASLRKGIHYTSAFTIDQKDVPTVKRQVLDLIRDHRSTVSNSGTEELYSFCCDFFEV